MAKIEYDNVQKEIFELTPVGKAYLRYNEEIGGEPFGYTVGMPDIDIEKEYGGLIGLYNECIKQGKTWEELLQTTGNWDELPEE